MSSVLLVQGIELDVSVADWEPVRLGAVSRSFSGTPRSSVRATKRDHHFVGDVGGIPIARAEFIRALVEGEGHSWSFETSELYSSRGLLPSYITPTDIRAGDEEGKWGLGLVAEDGSQVTWPLGYTGWWTLLFWRYVSGFWRHYIVRRRNLSTLLVDVWENDHRTDVDPEIITMDNAGSLNLICNAGDESVDELAVLPYAVPDEWVLPMYGLRSERPWAGLPFVTVSGLAFPAGPAKVLGQVGTAHRLPLRVGGAFTVGEVLDLTLQEC